MTTNKEKVQPIKWFAAKTKFSAEKKIKQFLERLGIEHYIPFRTVIKEKGGKKVKVEKPVIPNLIFIHSDYNTCLSLVNEYKLSMNYLLNLETRQLLVVPDKQMQDFMFLLDFSEDAVQVLNENLRQGDRVRVIKGEFAGIEGELIRIKGHKRVVVRLEGAFSLGEFYQFNLSSCIRQQNSLTAQFVSFSLSNLANIFYPPPDFYNN